jgi:hypothetical protein
VKWSIRADFPRQCSLGVGHKVFGIKGLPEPMNKEAGMNSGWMLILSVTFLLSVASCVFVIQEILKDNRKYQQFQQAPVCSGTGFHAGPTNDCHLLAPMTVTNKWYKDVGLGTKHAQDMRWTLELRQPDGGPYYTADFTGGPGIIRREYTAKPPSGRR